MTDPHPLVRAVADSLDRLGVGGPLLAACSGGGDSLALLRAVLDLRGDDPRSVTAGHFDHRQRADSAADGVYVAARCEAWGCGFADGKFDGGPDASEATLRAARYRFLAAAATDAGAAWVLTGHTADDQAETVLMRVVRGTGVAGLAGIPAVGPVPGPPGESAATAVRVARPLLGAAGAEARAFLAERDVAWRDDPTNATPDRTRTKLRHAVLPLLEELNPRVRSALLRLSDLARETAGQTDDLAEAVLDAALGHIDQKRRIELWDRKLPLVDSPARAAVLRAAWRRVGWPERRMDAAAWRRLAGVAAGRPAVEVPHGVRAVAATDLVVLTR